MSETKSNQYLWIAIGVLGAATLGLGAELLHTRTAEVAAQEPVPLLAANDPTNAPAIGNPPAVGAQDLSTSAKPAAASAAAKPAHKTTTTSNVKVTPKPAGVQQVAAAEPVAVAPAPVVMPERKPPLVICNVCGTVESVTPIEREAAQGSGLGVIAGAALGGIVGNQFGGGTGKDLATIAGMVGGGWAGNTVEKKMKKETVYEIKVRMEDGSLRKLEQKASIGIGTKVTVEGDKLTPA